MVHNSTQIHHDTTSLTTQKIQSSTDIQTNSHNLILGFSALSFFTGLTGSALYTHRKVSEYLRESATLSSSQLNSPFRAYRASIFTLQAFAVGSILCVSASGLIAFGVGAMLGVRNLYEFHKKMEELIPTYTPGLRKAVRNSQDIDQQEWKILEQEWVEEKNKYLAEREEKKAKWKNKKWW
ncbi:hypothetical protein C1645_839291 [Glomus cerebriforme]|uniref:Uncharacterized protein n=1 Tax=Glomus cerebriforme TaxID=658196 RepID=A0A397S5W3_9GLOM|nr:hypothetical protein C1645_839291 [Glomus cerebriforme]